jgi:hypothetical protein
MISDFVGTWDMVHDDWHGTLVIYPIDQREVAIDGPCTYTYYVLSGTYTGGDGVAREVRGTVGGQDANKRTSEVCKQSDHLIDFTVAFPNEPPQPFTGYMFTQQRRTMAGDTWWQGIPFGWYAIKR